MDHSSDDTKSDMHISRKSFQKWCLTALLIALVTALSPWGLSFLISRWNTPNDVIVEPYEWTDNTKEAYEGQMKESETLHAVAFALCGFVGGVVIIPINGKRIVVLRDTPERLMFFCVILAFILSIFAGHEYRITLRGYIFEAGMTGFTPDYRSFIIDYLRFSQIGLLITGLLFCGMKIISAKWFTGDSNG